MERDFRYLRDIHGDAGAREIFEKICTQLLYELNDSEAHGIRSSKGDAGIDILVGDFTSPIENYQCKYFIDGISDSQKDQIRKSFNTAIETVAYKMKRWVLCVPCTLNVKEFAWWSDWRNRMLKLNNSIEIDLWEGGFLITRLKQTNLYDTLFDNDTKTQLDEIHTFLTAEKKRMENDIIILMKEIDSSQYDGMTFVSKLECANIEDINDCKRDFFNAELSEQSVKSKGNQNDLQLLNNLKIEIYSLWQTQYRRYKHETDGNELLTKVYERVEDNAFTLGGALPHISVIAKKGFLHQWAEECSIGWLINYKQKLEEYLARQVEQNG
ncbi:MAG: hypothetical protein RR347_08570 [Anaerovoracaceae bacterium]